jgi:hypothetical protein
MCPIVIYVVKKDSTWYWLRRVRVYLKIPSKNSNYADSLLNSIRQS